MRLLGTIFSSLTMLCLLCAPALAQSSPSASQYEPATCPPSSTCVQSLGDGADDLSENAERGTDAVNDAMGAASASASAAPDDASAPGGSAPSGGDSAGNDAEGPGEIMKLPETGGAPLAALGSGILLTAFGLMAYRRVG